MSEMEWGGFVLSRPELLAAAGMSGAALPSMPGLMEPLTPEEEAVGLQGLLDRGLAWALNGEAGCEQHLSVVLRQIAETRASLWLRGQQGQMVILGGELLIAVEDRMPLVMGWRVLPLRDQRAVVDCALEFVQLHHEHVEVMAVTRRGQKRTRISVDDPADPSLISAVDSACSLFADALDEREAE